ncbi:hypothetical protein F5Y09DRAFT_192455 [Xylaria sp. FL1042]|nr:hypothetical protein F5Y09DRAFT_192455 [Xylaria sp. FL1042]
MRTLGAGCWGILSRAAVSLLAEPRQYGPSYAAMRRKAPSVVPNPLHDYGMYHLREDAGNDPASNYANVYTHRGEHSIRPMDSSQHRTGQDRPKQDKTGKTSSARSWWSGGSAAVIGHQAGDGTTLGE